MTRPPETPWGPAYSSREIAPGIVLYSTPSHGGYWLSPDRVAEMPKPLREFKPWAGPNWYEEDCDWSIVALAFPQYFPDDAQGAALATLQHYRPELFTEVVGMIENQGKHVYSIHYMDREFAREHNDPTLGFIVAGGKQEAQELAGRNGGIVRRALPTPSLWAMEILRRGEEKVR